MEEISAPNTVPDGTAGVRKINCLPIIFPLTIICLICLQIGETVSRPGTGNIWTVEGDHQLERQHDDDKMYDEESGGDTDMQGEAGLSEEDTKILLEKEFDDYYEDRAHKSAGDVILIQGLSQ